MTNNKKNTFILLLTMIALFLFFIRCTTQATDAIPGTYTSEWTTEFTEARDTMIIERTVKGGSDSYQITRRTHMRYQNKPEYKLVHWTGTFNSGNQTIIVNNNLRILSFDPTNKEMKMGSTTYKKLLP